MFPLMSIRSKRSTPSRSGRYDSVVVRLATPADDAAIQRVASLDGRKAPAGRVLVAEVDGEVIAALSVAGRQAVADPFRWTSDVVALMEMCAEQVATAEPHPAAEARGGAVQRLRTQLT